MLLAELAEPLNSGASGSALDVSSFPGSGRGIESVSNPRSELEFNSNYCGSVVSG